MHLAHTITEGAMTTLRHPSRSLGPATVALARDLMALGRLRAADGDTDGAAAHWLEAA